MEAIMIVPANRLRPTWLRTTFASVLLPGLVFGVLVGCTGKTNGPPIVQNSSNVPADTDSTGNKITPYVTATLTAFAPQQAAILSTISVTGSGFTTTNAVTINGVYATNVTINSDVLLTVQIPSNASTGAIEVLTTDFGNEFSTTSFTVVPQIAAIAPTSGPLGTVVSLSGSGFVGTTRVTVGNEPAAGPGCTFSSPTNANELTVTVSHDATTGPIQLTASGQTVAGPIFTVTQ